MENTCVFCKKDISNTKKQKYCSISCKKRHLKGQNINDLRVLCLNCSTEFERKSVNKKFCCKSCARDHWNTANPGRSAESSRVWRKNNPKKSRANIDNWRQNNLDRHKESERRWKKNNIDRCRENDKIWRENNKQTYRDTVNNWQRDKLENDPLFKMKKNIRSLVYNQIVRHRGYTKKSKTHSYLGDTYEKVFSHLKKTYEDRYDEIFESWDNVEIDHIIPCMLANNEIELIKLQHYSNLQLLKKSDHKSKTTQDLEWKK